MYTSQGLMYGDDYADYLKSTDQGTTTIQLDDVPDWFDASKDCPVCGERVADHESVTVQDASGEIFACVLDGATRTMPDPMY